MKTVPQNLEDLFGEMVEESKDEIKAKMKETLLTIINSVPMYIDEIIQSLPPDDFEEEDNSNN